MSASAPPLPQDLRARIDRVCRRIGLGPFAANTVERWVRSPPDTWASCCMGGCDPCNDVIRAAARKVLAEIEAEREV